MNKIILGLLLAVCVLGMALIMLNERLSRDTEPIPTSVAEKKEPGPGEGSPLPPPPPEERRPAPEAPSVPEPAQPLAPKDDGGMTQGTVQASRAVPPPAEPARDIAPPAQPDTEATPAPVKKQEELPVIPEKKQPDARKQEKQPAEKSKASADSSGKQQPPTEQRISRFVVFARDKGATVRVTGTGPLRYKTEQLHNPERLVVDLDGKWSIKAPGVPANPLVTNVRIGKLPEKTRIVIDFKEKPRSVRVILARERNSIDIRVDQ